MSLSLQISHIRLERKKDGSAIKYMKYTESSNVSINDSALRFVIVSMPRGRKIFVRNWKGIAYIQKRQNIILSRIILPTIIKNIKLILNAFQFFSSCEREMICIKGGYCIFNRFLFF